jgi:hypothetical protein
MGKAAQGTAHIVNNNNQMDQMDQIDFARNKCYNYVSYKTALRRDSRLKKLHF